MLVEIPTISVLVITFNHEPFIGKSIKSILSQRGNFHLQLVISNDKSTDKTNDEIEETLNAYTGPYTVNYFNQSENLGIIPNLIFALSKCNGAYLAICEGDDYWIDDNKLQKQLDYLNVHSSCSMVITNRIVLNEDGSSWEEKYDVFHNKTIFITEDIINEFIPGTQTFFVRNDKGLLDFFRINDDLDHGDRYIAYFFSLKGEIHLIPEAMATYKMTGTGAWSQNDGLQKLQTKARQLQEFHKRIGLPPNNKILEKYLVTCAFNTFKYCMKRPAQFKKPVNRYWIKQLINKFPDKRRLILVYNLLKNKQINQSYN